MDNFQDYLIRQKTMDYYRYNPPKRRKSTSPTPTSYTKILEPNVSEYVVFDLETTGMSADKSEIIEIGAVKVWNDEVVEEYSQLIHPEHRIPYFITNLTGISNEMVRNEPTAKDVLPKFRDFISDYVLIAHNASFDMRFLQAKCRQYFVCPHNDVIDTLYLSRKINKDCEKHTLEYLAKYFGIVNENAHRALSDALTTHKLYQIIKQNWFCGN